MGLKIKIEHSLVLPLAGLGGGRLPGEVGVDAGPPGVVPLPEGGGGGAVLKKELQTTNKQIKHTFRTRRWRWTTHFTEV